jgi:hypothetical protein
MVEHPKGSLIVEYLKVLWSSASGPLPMVEPAYASLTVEPAYASLTVEPAYASSPLLSLMVEHPKGTESLTIHMVRVLSLWSSASGPYQSSPLKGPYQSSPVAGPYQSSPLKGPY